MAKSKPTGPSWRTTAEQLKATKAAKKRKAGGTLTDRLTTIERLLRDKEKS